MSMRGASRVRKGPSASARAMQRLTLSSITRALLPPRRYNSSTSTLSSSGRLTSIAPTDSKQAYDRLRPILDHLPSQIDWAVAYGSGVKHQANAASGEAPMTDFLLATPDPLAFHTDNLGRNRSHYPMWARLAGEGVVSRVQEDYGAGIWYVTMVTLNGLEVKYGIISTDRLVRDLTQWDTFYTAGRLQKPVLTLISTSAIDSAQNQNLLAALSTSLLLSRPSTSRSSSQTSPTTNPDATSTTITEQDLYIQIAGLSYSGDPRMSIPGAENPDKVKNIVAGPGSLQAFRDLYADSLRKVEGLEMLGEGIGAGMDEGQGMIRLDLGPDSIGGIVGNLPVRLRYAIAQRAGLLGTSARSGQSWKGLELEQLHGELLEIKPREWADRFRRPDCRPMLLKELRDIMHGPALFQSMKGLATAGVWKSCRYGMAKYRKWAASRKK